MIRAAISLCLVGSLAALVLAATDSRTPAAVNPFAAAAASDDLTVFPVYSQSVTDPWNRIFHCLFTRSFRARISDEFGRTDDGPFIDAGDFLNLRVGTREIERTESGDRPIDPLYYPPADSPDGSRQLLTEPRYSMLAAALQEALNDSAPRTPVARALMQSDLWSAYDLIHWDLFPQDRGTILDSHKQTLSRLMAQLIKKLALTRQEIESLPDNYAAARAANYGSLPDLFSSTSDWIEFQWFQPRAHDENAGFRRASRVFIKPSHPPSDKQKFLNSLRTENAEAFAGIDSAVILIQPLLIDSQGRLTPTRLTTDVEIRLFQWSNSGAFQKTDVHTYEISRRLLLDRPASGGFEVQAENSPVYLSNGGSYGFAEQVAFSASAGDEPHLPVVVKLRARCAHCHAENLTLLMTFAIAHPPNAKMPSVKQLNQTGHQTAEFDITQKSKRAEWRALRAYFESSGGATN